MRTALVHDWLTGMRGGEKVLAAIGELFPQADLFTLIHTPGACEPIVRGRRVITSFLNDWPGVGRYYRYLLPLMPTAAEQFDLSGYELILSSSHCVAKGVLPPPGSLHVCYCHTPMRYVWAQQDQYARRMNWTARMGLSGFRRYLREWDRRSADRVDRFLANSQNVAGRIRAAYGREATVVWPPADTDFFTPAAVDREDFFLVVSALVPYKCVDHAVEAFGRLGLPLRVIGSGPMLQPLRCRAAANVRFLGWQSDESVREHYRRCRALIFPGEEDFGLTVVEAMACGTPVIAYGAGGVLETVRDGDSPCGILYQPHSVEALIEAVEQFQAGRREFPAQRLADRAGQFSKPLFQRKFLAAVRQAPHPGGANQRAGDSSTGSS